MLRTIRRLWDSYLVSVPKSEVVDSVPESQWDRADLLPPVSKAKRKAFADLLTIVYSHLPPVEASASVESGTKAFTRSDEADAALCDALLPDKDDATPKSQGFIGVDWKDAPEVQWQADQLCRAHGLSDRWQSPGGTVSAVLASLEAWLRPHNLELLCFSDGDLVVAFAVATERVAEIKALGKKLRVPFRRAGEA